MDIAQTLRAYGAHASATGGVEVGSPEAEIADVSAGKPRGAWLPDHVAIDFTGADALTFLQGQLTNDVAALTEGAVQWQGYCQPQGRLLATFPMQRLSAEAFVAVLPRAIATAIVKRLSMYVLRAKVKITQRDDALFCTFAASAAVDVAAMPLADGRMIYCVPAAQIEAFLPDFFSKNALASTNLWDYLSVQRGIVEIGATTQDKFVPQMIGFDTVGVNFKKGCYPGQEVVARAHYRGAVKRKLARLSGTGLPPQRGADLIVDTQAVGTCAMTARTSASTWIALASLLPDVRALPNAHLDAIGPITIEPLD